MKKVLFVCLGNICRSPAAEGAMVHLIKQKGLEAGFLIDSAGTSGFHEGDDPDHRMIAQAKLRNILLPSKSRPLLKSDFEKFDLIVCMDKSNLSNAKKIAEDDRYAMKLSMMTDYFQNSDFKKRFNEIPDPYYGSKKDFDLVLDLVLDASEGLLKKIHE